MMRKRKKADGIQKVKGVVWKCYTGYMSVTAAVYLTVLPLEATALVDFARQEVTMHPLSSATCSGQNKILQLLGIEKQ